MLVGDSSSSTLLSAYPQIAQQFPNNLACIFIRNTSITDSSDKLPYDTSEFKNIKNSSYFFYRTAEGAFSSFWSSLRNSVAPYCSYLIYPCLRKQT